MRDEMATETKSYTDQVNYEPELTKAELDKIRDLQFRINSYAENISKLLKLMDAIKSRNMSKYLELSNEMW